MKHFTFFLGAVVTMAGLVALIAPAGDAAFMKSCFPCHEKTKATDLVFTHYAP